MVGDAPLPWQQELWHSLQRRQREQTLPQALLLTGRAGLGKQRLAEALLAAWLCDAPRDDGRACGQCRSCTLTAARTHPDRCDVALEDDKKQIAIDAVRDLITALQRAPRLARRQVALIAPADRLNTAAANALLKTLEEPPGHDTVLLLVSERPAALPATVRSRCQTLLLRAPPLDVGVAWLVGQGVAASDAALRLRLCAGAPLAALGLDPALLDERRRAFADFSALLRGRADPFAVAERWAKRADLISGWLIGWHQDVLRLKMAGQVARPDHPDLLEGLTALAALQPAERWLQRLEQCERLRLWLQHPVHVALQLEACLIQWAP